MTTPSPASHRPLPPRQRQFGLIWLACGTLGALFSIAVCLLVAAIFLGAKTPAVTPGGATSSALNLARTKTPHATFTRAASASQLATTTLLPTSTKVSPSVAPATEIPASSPIIADTPIPPGDTATAALSAIPSLAPPPTQAPAPTAAPAASPLGARTKTLGCVAANSLPDPACTPGEIIPDATAAQICVPGYSSSVRNVSDDLKDQVYAEYGIATHSPGQYEVDHLIPLELGGSNDIANLFAQPADPRPGFHEKDQVENWLHDQVCSGAMLLADAQLGIAQNWVQFYQAAAPTEPTTAARIAPIATAPAPPISNCDPVYPDVCIPPPPPDLDCKDIPYRRFRVLPPDPHRFDGDHDGIGCES